MWLYRACIPSPPPSDSGSVGGFGEMDFQQQTSESFQAQLAKDEEELQKANLLGNVRSGRGTKPVGN